MSKVLDELVKLLALEKIEENVFRGQSQDLGWGIVFGGQVLGQALSAAVQTVRSPHPGAPPPASEERQAHSIHAYFLRPGDVSRPVVYNVDRIRDGSSFTTRRVVAIQAGQPIFNLAASFQKLEPGFAHQEPMPEVPPPEQLPSQSDSIALHADKLPRYMRERPHGTPFELRRIGEERDDPVHPPARPPVRYMWIRANGTLPDDPALHRCLLAYASDHGFLTTSLLPHATSYLTPGMQIASLDHTIWFHDSFRVDDWLLHAMQSPFAGGARGLTLGRVFTRDGRLVATTAQEGLIRKRAT